MGSVLLVRAERRTQLRRAADVRHDRARSPGVSCRDGLSRVFVFKELMLRLRRQGDVNLASSILDVESSPWWGLPMV